MTMFVTAAAIWGGTHAIVAVSRFFRHRFEKKRHELTKDAR